MPVTTRHPTSRYPHLGIGARAESLETESPDPARVASRSPSRCSRASIAVMDSRSAPSPGPADRAARRASSMSGTAGRNGSRPSAAARPAPASSLRGAVTGVARGGEQQHLLHVLAGLGIRGNSLEGVHGPLARVVRRDGAREIAGKPTDQMAEMAHAALDVLPGIEHVLHAERARRPRHELHQPLRPLGGDREGVERRLDLDDGLDQLPAHAVPLGALADLARVSARAASAPSEAV